MKILAILQNQWFNYPEKIRAMLARHDHEPERREKLRRNLIHHALFAGCLTGRRLRAAFGIELCKAITWEESSREIGGFAASKFPPDPKRLAAVIDAEQPRIILAFGNNATNGCLKAMQLIRESRFLVITGPHPAARGGTTMQRLNEIAEEVKQEIR